MLTLAATCCGVNSSEVCGFTSVSNPPAAQRGDRIHPVAGRDGILERRRNHKFQELLGQFRLFAGGGTRGDFHLQIVAFGKIAAA
jgi:hypothetical protein